MATLCQNATTPRTARARQARDFTNLALWTFQGWIAMFFVAAGYAKLTEPMDNLALLLDWPEKVSLSLVRGVGIVEIVLALGMLMPLFSWKIGRWPLLVSAAGLVALQTVMLGVHIIGADVSLVITNVLLLAITIPVLLGRRPPC
ncbi:DoxX family protein [Brevundimonas variabilis]|uniref:Putative membrane protein n=1 Tax=Brevundimonas variabilis TaxID=74312 RepID=A0A7W9CFV0_9CAUL|nr:DoxX family protein [Brevundimonas variabilis]MBB5744893.1 putative membrane protein [Brevundimonas variabilis]